MQLISAPHDDLTVSVSHLLANKLYHKTSFSLKGGARREFMDHTKQTE